MIAEVPSSSEFLFVCLFVNSKHPGLAKLQNLKV